MRDNLISVGFVLVVLVIALLPIGSCTYDIYRRHVGGNQKVFDTAWKFKYADVYLPDGKMKTIEIETWNDYEGEQIQIRGKDGVNYIVSSFNTILRSK